MRLAACAREKRTMLAGISSVSDTSRSFQKSPFWIHSGETEALRRTAFSLNRTLSSGVTGNRARGSLARQQLSFDWQRFRSWKLKTLKPPL
jgi:hypothetical protein